MSRKTNRFDGAVRGGRRAPRGLLAWSFFASVAILAWAFLICQAPPAPVFRDVGAGLQNMVSAAQDGLETDSSVMRRSAAETPPGVRWVPLTVLWEDSTPATGIASVECFISGNTVSVHHRNANMYGIAAPEVWSRMSIVVRGAKIETAQKSVALAEVDVQDGLVVFVRPAVGARLQVIGSIAQQPVANIVVELHGESMASSLPEFSQPLRATSDVEGYLPLAGLGRRLYRVEILPGSGYRLVKPALIDLARSPEPSLVQILVKEDKDWAIRGRVLAADTKRGLGGVTLDRGGQSIACTDPNGYFVVPGSVRQQGNAMGYGGDLVCSAMPSSDCGYSALRLAGPFPWGADDAIVELLPSRRILRVVGSDGEALSTAASLRQASRPTLLGSSRSLPQEWVQLLPSAGGGLEMPPTVDWLQTVWVRLDAPFEHAGLFMDVRDLRQTFESGAMVYEWVMPRRQEYHFLVHSQGSVIGGATVEVMASVGTVMLQTAQARADCDPTTSNPLTSNVARLLARGVTDHFGRCTMTFQATPNAQVRARSSSFLAAVQDLGESGEVTILSMTGAGGIRGKINGSLRDVVQVVQTSSKDGCVISSPQARSSFRASLVDGAFELLEVPIGTYEIFGMLHGKGNRPVYRLGEAVVVAGRITEFATTASPPEAVRVEIKGPDLGVGDRIEFVDTVVSYPVAVQVVDQVGQASVQLTSGTYRVLRYRRDLEVASQPMAAVANETLVVGPDMTLFTLSFPKGPLQVRLLDESQTVAHVWVMVEGLGQVARTDDLGWFSLPTAPATEFILVEAKLSPAGQWRPGNRRWKGSLHQGAATLTVITER